MQHNQDEQARFERMFRAHHASVHAFVRRRTDPAGVDDIVSETFLVAWRRLDDVPEDPIPWLLGVARNAIGTARRGDARRLRLQARAQAEYQDRLDPDIQSVDGDRVLAALERLNERDRETLTLIAWDGLTPTQAAGVLGIPVNRFRVRLHRAAKRLRWAIDADAQSDELGEPRPPAVALRGVIPADTDSQGAIA
jgi:RNA polymerase sigma-70 factor, ECF subfamily